MASLWASSAVNCTQALSMVAPRGTSTPAKRSPTSCSRVLSRIISRSLLTSRTAPEERRSSASSVELAIGTVTVIAEAAAVCTWRVEL